MQTSILDDVIKGKSEEQPEDERQKAQSEIPESGLYLWLRKPHEVHAD